MMWQGIIVAALVGACVLYLARRWYRMLAGKSVGCGCSDCPSKQRDLKFNPISKNEGQE